MKNNKKILHKQLLVILLAVVLIAANANGSTFAWYATSGIIGGGYLEYDSVDMPINRDVNNISCEHFSSPEGKVYTPVDSISGTTLTNNSVSYHKSSLTNTGNSARYVSLYIKQISYNRKFALGVTSPIYSHKTYLYENEAPMTSTTTKRVYFQLPTYNDIWSSSANFEVVWWTGETDDETKVVTKSTRLKLLPNSSPPTYYADIHADANFLYFHVVNTTNEKKNRTSRQDYLIRNNCTATSTAYFISQNTYDSTYNNLNVEKRTSYNDGGVYYGANIASYYQNVSVPMGKTQSISLTKNTNCVYYGNKISYEIVSGDAYFSLSSTGMITAISEGSGKIKTTVTGYYGDTYSVYTDVIITRNTTSSDQYIHTDIPIIKNLYIKPYETIDVYWYIKNESSQTLTYTMLGLYLGA